MDEFHAKVFVIHDMQAFAHKVRSLVPCIYSNVTCKVLPYLDHSFSPFVHIVGGIQTMGIHNLATLYHILCILV